MKISELSRTSGVSVATIKYYLREGLLPPGERKAPNQAEYAPLHLHRLRLIRALIEVGGLGIGAVHSVLEAIGRDDLSLHALLGVAHHALGPAPDEGPEREDTARAYDEVDDFLAGMGWRVSRHAPARWTLANTLAAMRRLGFDAEVEVFSPYAEVADKLAARELAQLPTDLDRAQLVEQVVIRTVVFESALVALRRLAQEHHSASRWAAEPAT